jgi:hypothetical protein
MRWSVLYPCCGKKLGCSVVSNADCFSLDSVLLCSPAYLLARNQGVIRTTIRIRKQVRRAMAKKLGISRSKVHTYVSNELLWM